jgi:NAD-dependent SIR2 family protein deacetylase
VPWGKRQHPTDQPIEISFGTCECPRCGKRITKNAFGRISHIRACLKRDLIYKGEVHPGTTDPKELREAINMIRQDHREWKRRKRRGEKDPLERLIDLLP